MWGSEEALLAPRWECSWSPFLLPLFPLPSPLCRAQYPTQAPGLPAVTSHPSPLRPPPPPSTVATFPQMTQPGDNPSAQPPKTCIVPEFPACSLPAQHTDSRVGEGAGRMDAGQTSLYTPSHKRAPWLSPLALTTGSAPSLPDRGPGLFPCGGSYSLILLPTLATRYFLSTSSRLVRPRPPGAAVGLGVVHTGTSQMP